ncbi:MAG: hypothetical protein OEV49_00675 [candidate division Zixibacteria bacterium]|nr:hypothetical protein [candidate division Zixibacteria bacterium]MDH3936414.1 hypothetical protein [candidate division Zixibacteria bacterium]MDH4034480.1 hypothetical protein [candidate division Zixibacteria bacterium]
MKRQVTIELKATVPSSADVLNAQSVPKTAHDDSSLQALAEQGIAIFRKLAQPIGMYAQVELPEFERIYHGVGANDNVAPLPHIAQASDKLALYCVTLGQEVCARISQLFDSHEYPLATMLDAAASTGAELAAEVVQKEFELQLDSDKLSSAQTGVMPFSPGYCGWHVSGQRALFDFLKPEEIGVSLNESCLMQPLKSISGVMVSGIKEIFYFEDVFPFCASCATRSCRARIASLEM